MERSLFIELIHCTKSALDSIKDFTQLSRGKLNDKEFSEFFYKVITKDIEEHNLLLNTFLKYIESTTPITKKDTVNKLVEELLKKHRLQLEEKKIRIFRKYEKDLPETMVPDEKLRFILDSVLQYAITSADSNGNIELSAKSVLLPKGDVKDQESLKTNGEFVEIMVAFTGFMEVSGVVSPRERVSSDLVFQLVEISAKMSQGAMRFELDEMESKHRIFMRFPSERRKVIYYQSADELRRIITP